MHKKSVGVSILISFLLAVQPAQTLAQAPAVPSAAVDTLALDIKGMDILDVLRILSMKGGLNIVAGKNVTGKVTLFLKDVQVWDAFEIIIAANDLAYEKRGDIIYVMTERDYELSHGRQYEDKRVVKSIKLSHGKADDIAKAVAQLKTNIGKVVADDTAQTIILMDIPEVVADMESIIKQLDLPITTKVYSLQYATAEQLKDKLSEMITKNVGGLRIDERTNKVAITDLEERMPLFDKVIEAFDEKHREVLIEAKILQITLNDDYRFGINWDAVFTKMQRTLHHVATIGVNMKYANQAAVIPTTAATSALGGAVQVGQLDAEGYQVVLQALKEYGRTNLLSSPRIVALNNQEAKILVGSNQPYATRTISQGSGGTGNIEGENITYLDLGLKLYVTPTINKDNYITMKIKPEVSSKLSDYTTSVGNRIPVVKTTTTETTVMVKDNATILIGGLIEEKATESVREVPGLANIPLLGNLFRSKTTGDVDNPEKTELVIFLTPHIVTGDENQDMLTVKRLGHDTVMEKLKEQTDEVSANDLKDVVSDYLLPDEYYNIISTMITQRVATHKQSVPVYGEVVVSFTLNKEGRLLGEPSVFRGDNELLARVALQSIHEASPFPSFPQGFAKDREEFQITIRYE